MTVTPREFGYLGAFVGVLVFCKAPQTKSLALKETLPIRRVPRIPSGLVSARGKRVSGKVGLFCALIVGHSTFCEDFTHPPTKKKQTRDYRWTAQRV